MTEDQFRELLGRGFDGIAHWEATFRRFKKHPSLEVSADVAARALDELATRLKDNYPFFHPDYAGQMLRPPHPIALIAYAMTARINPNNHALDGGPATAQLERECIDQLAAMFALRPPYLGHLTTSGTIANLEALWVASRLQPGKAVAFSSEAHYTHGRMCELLGVPTVVAPVTARGAIDLDALGALGDADNIGTLVVTAGTTATGAVDPIDAALDVARDRGWRVHVDAAYGGFFTLLADEPEAALDSRAWHAISNVDSIVVDPHKHGLQPYGCGAVLFADPGVGSLYKHASPYTYFTSNELHLGEISLECSRPGAAAAALWVTLRCFPLSAQGLGASLAASRQAALRAYEAASINKKLTPVTKPELDILTIAPMGRHERSLASTVSVRSETIFNQCLNDRQHPLFLAKWHMPKAMGELALPQLNWDEGHCTVLRSVMMKPEHEHNANAIIERLATM